MMEQRILISGNISLINLACAERIRLGSSSGAD